MKTRDFEVASTPKPGASDVAHREASLVIDDGGELALIGQFGFASAVKDQVCGGQ